MFALKSGQAQGTDAAAPGVLGAWLSAPHFVLPRWLRRPVRVAARLGSGDFTPPPFCATIGPPSF